MTPDLIARLLQQPLPVRLALLDAEPNGIGCFVPVVASEPGNCYVAMRVTPYERKRVQDGAAWLPCNPLAIVRHAIAMDRKRLFETSVMDKVPDQLRVRELVREALSIEVTSEENYMRAIALLREVVGC